MTTWHNFLVEHAVFPFPSLDESRTIDSTRISTNEAGLIEPSWKARHAIRDNSLVQKLCTTLQNILADDICPEAQQQLMLNYFSPVLLSSSGRREWEKNENEPKSEVLLEKGVFNAASAFFFAYELHDVVLHRKTAYAGTRSMVDFVVVVNDEPMVLCEAKSPSVMRAVGNGLPQEGVELLWRANERDVARNVLNKAVQYLGLRKLEWLFISSHNHWIVCRLVSHDRHPFLVYSEIINIHNSSEPFRALLGAILSVLRGVDVERNEWNPALKFDLIVLEADPGVEPEDDIDDRSGPYRGSTSKRVDRQGYQTRSGAHQTDGSGLMITTSSPSYPEPLQTWAYLPAFPNNKLVPPQHAGDSKQRVWLTRPIGSGTTGDVWQCHFDGSNMIYAIKVVEVLHPSDEDRRQRLHDEFNVYLLLEDAYASGQLCDRITPRCHGAFGSDYMDVVILDICDRSLRSWDELNPSERSQVYELVQGLHSIGLIHGDLEPRNVVRVHGGGFRLIDFSQSRMHICTEGKADKPQRQNQCHELCMLRSFLRPPLKALKADVLNL